MCMDLMQQVVKPHTSSDSSQYIFMDIGHTIAVHFVKLITFPSVPAMAVDSWLNKCPQVFNTITFCCTVVLLMMFKIHTHVHAHLKNYKR